MYVRTYVRRDIFWYAIFGCYGAAQLLLITADRFRHPLLSVTLVGTSISESGMSGIILWYSIGFSNWYLLECLNYSLERVEEHLSNVPNNVTSLL